MSVSVKVTVNGAFKVPITVKRGEEKSPVQWLSGAGRPGESNSLDIPGNEGDLTVTLGQEQPDDVKKEQAENAALRTQTIRDPEIVKALNSPDENTP